MNIENACLELGNKPEVETITWSNLPRWARRTYNSDLKTYIPAHQSITLSGIAHSLFPSLKQPLFLIGSPRSGTTFLGKCIASLPEISYHFEPIATKAAARYVYEGRWSETEAKWFYKSVYKWLMRVHFNGNLRFAEKTPRNCFLIPFLAKAFPDAQFIHILRDGRDVALSLSKKPWFLASEAKSGRFEPGGYPYGPFAQFWVEPERVKEFETTSDIHRCIWVWKRFTEEAINGLQGLSSNRYLEIRYESLAFETHKETQRLKDFLNINSSTSFESFRKALLEVNPKLSAKWKTQLSDNQLSEIDYEAGELLSSLGYYSE